MARLDVNRSGELEVFVQAIELGGFSAAARACEMTPSAVSKLVARLERRLGTRLLNRSTRQLKLTPEGCIFMSAACVSARDAETLDPTWLDTLAAACEHKNRTVNQTVWSVLSDIQHDPTMRHQHSQMAAIVERLGAPQTPQQMANRASLREPISHGSITEPGNNPPGSDAELSQFKRSSDTELSHETGNEIQSSFSELILESVTYKDSTKPNCNVRNFTHSVNKKTYVPELPAELQRSMAEDDRRQITAQLCALPAEATRQVLDSLVQTMARGNLHNPTAWLLTVIKRARNGELFTAGKYSHPVKPEAVRPAPMSTQTQPVRPQAASREHVSSVVAKLRQEMARARIRK